MPTIIRDLPVEDERSTISVGESVIPVLPFQAIVWVSIVAKGSALFDPRTPRIPAVVDLGFNGTLAVRQEQLRQWAGLDAQSFQLARITRLRGASAEHRLANIWLHPNIPGRREPSGQPPLHIELRPGIIVMQRPAQGESDDRPRLPLLGFRALHRAALQLAVDCQKGRLSLRTPRRFWLFS